MVQHQYDDELALDIHTERTGCRTVVALGGELDYFTVPLLRRALTDVGGEKGDIVFDIAGLRFVDAAGIGCLASAVARARASGGRARVARPSPMAARVIDLLGLGEVTGLSGESSPERSMRRGRHRRHRPAREPSDQLR